MTDTNSKAQVTDAFGRLADEWAVRCGIVHTPAVIAGHEDQILKHIKHAYAEGYAAAALAAQEKPEPGVAQAPTAWIGKDALERLEAIHEMRAGFIAAEIGNSKWGDRFNVPLYLHPAPSPDLPEGEVELACPVCLVPFLPDDICATDIEMGICHAECLEGSPVVDLDTGDELPDGTVDTFLYGDTDPTSPSPIEKGEAK